MNQNERDRIDDLMNKLTKPLYILRMARWAEGIVPPKGYEGYPSIAMIKSANKRADNARREIDTIIKEYVRESGLMTFSEKEFAEWLGTANEG